MSRKSNSIVTRTSSEMLKEIREIQQLRIMRGKDKYPKVAKAPRISLAMTRHPLFKKIKDDIVEADLK